MRAKNTNRLHWLDGIKGLSCLFIFFHHFMLISFPASHYGNAKPSLLNGFDAFLPSCPFLGIIVNGNFFVHLFILISGYVIAWQTLQMEKEKVGLFSLKRYLKLLFPLAVCALVYYVPHIYNTIQMGGGIVKETHKYLRSLFIGIPFYGDSYFYGPFWMLNYILLGGIFVSLIASLTWILDPKKTLFVPLAFVLALYLSLSTQNAHWASALLGCALCLFNTFYEVSLKKTLLLILPAALFFGSFPSGLTPQNIFRFFIFPINPEVSAAYWHSFAAFLFILFASNSAAAQKLFSKNAFKALGKISLWVYVFHGIAIDWAAGILNLAGVTFQQGGESYVLKRALHFALSSALLILMSAAAAKYLTPLGNRAVLKIIKAMSPKPAQTDDKATLH